MSADYHTGLQSAPCCCNFFFCGASTQFRALASPPYCASRSHADTPHSVGLLWSSDQPDAETSTWQHTTLTSDKNPCSRGDANSQSQQASGSWPTPWTAGPLGSTCCCKWVCSVKFGFNFALYDGKANWIGHILRRHCLRNYVTEGRVKGRIKVVGRQWKRRKQLLHNLQERRWSCNLKDGAPDRTRLWTRFGRGYGPVSRQWRRNEWIVRCWQVRNTGSDECADDGHHDWKWTCFDECGDTGLEWNRY